MVKTSSRGPANPKRTLIGGVLLLSLLWSHPSWAVSSSIVVTVEGGGVTATASGSFGSCPNGGGVTLKRNNVAIGSASGSGSASVTRTLDRGTLHGTNTFQAYAADCTGYTTQSYTLVLDNTPSVTVTGPSGVVSGPFDITGTVVFKPTLSATKGTVSVQFTGTGTPTTVATKACTTETCAISYQEITGILYERNHGGPYTVRLYASGGGAVASASQSFTVDNMPSVTVTSPLGVVSSPFDITGMAVFKPKLSAIKGTMSAQIIVGGTPTTVATKTCLTETCGFSYQEVTGGLYTKSPGSYTVRLYASGGGATASDSDPFSVVACTVTSTGFSADQLVIDPGVGGATKLTGNLTDSSGRPISWNVSVAGRTWTGAGGTLGNNVVWDGKDALGRLVEPGTYTATLNATNGVPYCSAPPRTVQITVTAEAAVGPSCPTRRHQVGSSADVAGGMLQHDQDLFETEGTGMPLRFILAYHSANAATPPLGDGWTHNYAMRLTPDNAGGYVLATADGNRLVLLPSGAAYRPAAATYPVMTINPDTTRDLREHNGTHYTFAVDGRLTAITDRNGNTVVVAYTNGDLTSLTDSGGRVATLASDATHRLASIVDPSGAVHTFSYQGSLLTGVTSTELGGAVRTWQYTYNPAGLLVSKTNPRGDLTQYVYDASQRVINITDPEGGVRTVTYPALSSALTRTSTVTEPDAGVWTYTYDTRLGLVLSKADPLAHTTTYAYNGNRRLSTQTGPDGSVTQWTYDTDGNVLTTTDPLGHVTAFTYNGFGQVTSRTDALGHVTAYTYDVQGNLLTLTDATGAVTQYQYDTAGRVIQVTTPLAQVIALAYDSAGNLMTVTDPTGAVTTYAYDGAGHLTTQTDALGRTTTLATDGFGQVRSRTAPDAGTTTWTYDGAGHRLTETDANAHATTWTYNFREQVTSVTDAAANVTRYTYGSTTGCGCTAGGDRLLSVTDPTGAHTTFTYDAAGRRINATDAMSHVTSFTYDTRDRLVSQTDANGRVTSYTYDAVNRLLTETDPVGGVTAYSYDAVGNLLSVTDPKNSVTGYTYDAANRRTQETRPLGQVTSYAYDAGGNLTTLTDGKGQVTTLTYDAGNRLTARTFADSTQDTFSYNAVGNLTGYIGSGLSGTLTYDAQHRKLSEGVNFGSLTKTYSYTYDGVGNETSLTTPEGAVSTYAYNAINQPTSVTSSAGTISATYDHGRLSGLAFPNGVATNYQYTATSWLSGLSTVKGAVSVLTRQHAFDGVGNILTRTSETGSTTYIYDALSRLTDAVPPVTQAPEHYTYDAVGNRLTSATTAGTWGYNANHQLLTYAATTNTYDANGQLVQTTDGSQVTTFGYNSRNRMAQVTLPNGQTASYTYDPFGRRVKKDVAGTVTYFLYSDEGLLAEYDAAGTLQRGYGWWPQTAWGTAPLGQTEGGQTYAIHTDHLGTPQKVTDSTGAVVWSATYSAFGEASVDPASTITHNLRFPGQYHDEGTRLHYNLNRDYDSTIGRYRQTDPIGLAGGVNTYGYAMSNPLLGIDPLGLEVFVGQHPAFLASPNNPVNHAAIVLMPDNPRDFIDHPVFKHSNGQWASIGGQAFGEGRGIFGRLTGEFNYPGDSPQSLNDLTAVCRPEGQSDAEFILNLVNIAKTYDNSAHYDPFPDRWGRTFNSNSYVSGLLIGAGVSPPPLPGIRPGYGRPLPFN